MADDWQPGDLAQVIVSGWVRCPHRYDVCHTGTSCPPRYAIKVVARVRATLAGPSGAPVEPCGCVDLHFSDGSRAAGFRCRKIRPHTPDAEDAETIRLLNGAPIKEPVTTFRPSPAGTGRAHSSPLPVRASQPVHDAFHEAHNGQ
jgi:hypothetical protein